MAGFYSSCPLIRIVYDLLRFRNLPVLAPAIESGIQSVTASIVIILGK
jgi:hypothetical protein